MTDTPAAIDIRTASENTQGGLDKPVESAKPDATKSLPYVCRHCGGDVVVDKEHSAPSWKVFICANCKSNAPLSVEDIMREMA